jgi:hypothetical protein
MPLLKGKKARTRKGIAENIKREKAAHPEMPINQAVAIAYSQARRAGADIPKKRAKKKK